MMYVDHPRANRNMGAPPGLEANVGTLRIEDVPNGMFGRAMTSFWKLSGEDMKVLAAGGVITLTIYGAMHPVVSMNVTGA